MDVVKCLSGWYGDRRGAHEEECSAVVGHTRTSLSPTPSLSVVIIMIISRIMFSPVIIVLYHYYRFPLLLTIDVTVVGAQVPSFSFL